MEGACRTLLADLPRPLFKPSGFEGIRMVLELLAELRGALHEASADGAWAAMQALGVAQTADSLKFDVGASSGDGEVVTVGPEVSASSRDEGAN